MQFVVYTLRNFIILSLDNWQLSWSGTTRFAVPVLLIQLFFFTVACFADTISFFTVACFADTTFSFTVAHFADTTLSFTVAHFADTTFSSLLPVAMACSSDITLHYLTLTANLLHHPHQGQSTKNPLKFNEHTSLLSHAVSDNRYEIIMVALEKPLRDHVECWHTSWPFPECLPDTISGTEPGELQGKKGTLLSHGQLHRLQFASITIRYCQGKSCHHDHVMWMAFLCHPNTGEPQHYNSEVSCNGYGTTCGYSSFSS